MSRIVIDVNAEGLLICREVYSGVLFETFEGNRLGICMRDDTFEINVLPAGVREGKWHRVDMQTGTIYQMGKEKTTQENVLKDPA